MDLLLVDSGDLHDGNGITDGYTSGDVNGHEVQGTVSLQHVLTDAVHPGIEIVLPTSLRCPCNWKVCHGSTLQLSVLIRS